MADTRLLTDHEDIRDWVAARVGAPAIRRAVPSISDREPQLMLVFDQRAYEDQGLGADRPSDETAELVDWDEWFALFDRRGLALIVAKEEPGYLDQFHELVRR